MKKFLINFANNPTVCLAELIEKKELSPVFLSYALGVVSVFFALKLNSQSGAGIFGFCSVFMLWFIFNIALNFVLAATSYLFLEINGKKTSSIGIFSLLGLSQSFLILLVPWCLIAKAFNTLATFTPLVVLLIIFAQIYFVLTMLKKLFAVDKANSLLAFILSFILPAVLSVGFVLSFISFIAILAS